MKTLCQILGGFCLAFVLSTAAVGQSITNEPSNITVNTASVATFSVGASGATNYQWRFNGTNLTNSATITGATNSVLTIDDVSTNQAGNYTVVINNSVTSAPPALLTIVPGTIVTFIFTNFAGGGHTNVEVQLFNHDKPVTVQNFLQYVTSGAYTNMFFDRVQPGFVLQGGDDGTSNRVSSTPPITGWSIQTEFTDDNEFEPPFTDGITNEFNVGPLIPNEFGTIAMALSGQPNSATSAFFFNLGDNTGILDTTNNGPFTVFGRVTSETNILEYFNGLSAGNGAVEPAAFLEDGMTNTIPGPNLGFLPVNYIGTNAPGNSSLIYCDFQLMSPPSATNLPTISISYPPADFLTNDGGPLTIEGTAIDTNNIGLAWVRCVLIPIAASDGTLPNGGVVLTNYVLGATNWSLSFPTIPPGYYELSAQVQDEAGNLSAEASLQPLIITAIATNGNGTVTFTNGAITNFNAIGYPFQTGSNYNLIATAGTNEIFIGWSDESQTNINSELSYTTSYGELAATFVSNTLPNSIAFTAPPASVVLSNGAVQVSGTISISNVPSPPVTITCTVFSEPSGYFAVSATETNAATNWSVIVTGLDPGAYLAQVEAVDQAGNSTVITENFTATADISTISILYPPTNSLVTDNNPLTASGIASDQIGVQLVICELTPVAASDGTLPSGGISSQFAEGTNWSVNFGVVPPGVYILSAEVLGEGGNTNEQTETITNTAVLINGNGSVSLTQGGTAKPNPVGYPLVYGKSYTLVATPSNGQAFIAWSEGSFATTSPTITFTNSAGLLLTATFVPSNSVKGISITSPAANARLATNSFSLKGRMTSAYKSAAVSCQISSLTTGYAAGPLRAVSGATTWAAAVSNLPPDNYVVTATATNAAGQSSIISEKFSVLDFADAAGTYTGIFICTNYPVAPTNSGFLTFSVNASGVFSGKLVFPAYPAIPIYPTPFENVEFTEGYFSDAIDNFHGSPLKIMIYVDLSGGTELALGTISSSSWSSQLVCHRAVTKLSTDSTPAPGKYILSLQPGYQTNGPGTNGYIALVVAKNGGLAISGALPDNTTFSESARVSTNGIWPLYVIPGGDRDAGMLMGWETNDASGVCDGQLYWYKAAGIGDYYTSGVGVISNMFMNSPGTNYLRPVTGSQYSIVFEGGTIVSPLTNALVVNEQGQFVVSGEPDDKLKISVSPNGVITGSLLNNGTTLKFKGAFISPTQGGSGFIPDAGGKTGMFQLTP
jgi:cyclophilin family peptidyl-prolyl cis-trans isomerase